MINFLYFGKNDLIKKMVIEYRRIQRNLKKEIYLICLNEPIKSDLAIEQAYL